MIRKATLSDINALAQLFDEYRVFYKKQSDVQGATQFITERLQNNESVIFVDENEQQCLTGFVQLYPIFSSTRMKRLWVLNDLYVNPKFRSKGISIGLITKAKELAIATNAAGLTLETAKTNSIGNNLYPKADFMLDSDHNFYAWDV